MKIYIIPANENLRHSCGACPREGGEQESSKSSIIIIKNDLDSRLHGNDS